jgi:tRNA 2-thiouridine synthesizing protein C
LSAIIFVFRTSPHSSSAGREGIDALLAASAYSEDLCALFIGDGVTQLLDHQHTDAILSKHYAPMFKLLELYDIDQVFVCAESLKQMGIRSEQLIIDVKVLDRQAVSQKLHDGAKLLSF